MSATASELVFEGTTQYVALGVPAGLGGSCAEPNFGTGVGGNHAVAIQDAIDAASDGDIIHICSGTWNLNQARLARVYPGDHLNTNSKRLKFVGNGRDLTILNGVPENVADKVRVFSSARRFDGMEWEPLAFADMQIQGGIIDWSGGGVAAAGVSCERVDFINNESDAVDPELSNGGAIYSEGDVYIDDCFFEGNIAENNGGAIAVLNGDVEIVNGSEFTDNDAGNAAGAVWVYQDAVESGTLLIEDSIFTLNHATGDMGAVAYYNTDQATIRSSTFTGNSTDQTSAQRGGALGGLGDLEVTDSEFINNNGDSLGGAIFVGDLGTGAPASLVVQTSVFENNDAMIGGAIYAGDTVVTVSESRFGRSSESGSCEGEGTEFGNEAIEGGAIMAESLDIPSSLDVRGSSFYYNCAYNFAADDGSGDGGAIGVGVEEVDFAPLAFDLNIEASRFVGNGADSDGGAIYSSIWSIAPIRIFANTFSANDAGLDRAGDDEDRGQGGAVRLWFASHQTEIIRNTFDANASDQGGALSMNDGGGDDPRAYTWTVRSNLFSKNRAEDNGGALHMALDDSGVVSPRRVSRNTFVGNRAPVGGAIVVESDVGSERVIQRRFTRALEENRFRGNRATENRRTNSIGVHFD
jgi:predicted outer membrane repeat protein